ncbi:MAG: N-acetyltransferase [Chitinophagaceae bacterium]|nr:N-acetyltransferase [Chitinophagaceae bacterium]
MINQLGPENLPEIYEIINDAASAYRNVIPPDRLHDPYMSGAELNAQVSDGVEFWGYIENGRIIGVMGIQFKGEVTLIRHAYVRTSEREKGVGSMLLKHLRSKSETPILIGTWADANWAIGFYQKHGFRLVPLEEKNRLLNKYWKIPGRQVETSVVLASPDFKSELS